MRGIFAIILCGFALRDLKEKEIPWSWFIGAALPGILGNGVLFIQNWGEGNLTVSSVLVKLAGILPGIFLLAVSKLSREAVGDGDGWFFIVSGIYLGIWDNLALLLYGLLLCSACSLGIFAWGLFSSTTVKNYRLPFLPFLIPAMAWIWFFL